MDILPILGQGLHVLLLQHPEQINVNLHSSNQILSTPLKLSSTWLAKIDQKHKMGLGID